MRGQEVCYRIPPTIDSHPHAEGGLEVDDRLLAEVSRQLDAQGLILRRGELRRSSMPPSSRLWARMAKVAEQDPEAVWTKKVGKSHYGYKGHPAVTRA